MSQQNPLQALQFGNTTSAQCQVQLPDSLSYGSVSVGGFVACVMAEYAISYAAQQLQARAQTDLRSAHVQFFRPVIPARGPVTLKIYEVNLGRAWSTFRVDAFQAKQSKFVASSNVILTDFSAPGISLNTSWQLHPSPPSVDLDKLERHADPNWACYHTAFHHQGFRRAYASVKNYIPKCWPTSIMFTEQWVTPGWDCAPLGSRDPSLKEARWTNELIQFAADLSLPVQENFAQSNPDRGLVGSIAATLQFAAMQEKARIAGVPEWRRLPHDGSMPEDGSKFFLRSLLHATLTISTEIKKKLPDEGVRWLYLRSEVKSIQNGKMDLQVLLFDEAMDLVAISSQVAQIIRGVDKTSNM